MVIRLLTRSIAAGSLLDESRLPRLPRRLHRDDVRPGRKAAPSRIYHLFLTACVAASGHATAGHVIHADTAPEIAVRPSDKKFLFPAKTLFYKMRQLIQTLAP